MFNQINSLPKNFYCNLRYIIIWYYSKFRKPMCHRQFFRKSSQNHEYMKKFCRNDANTFYYACRQGFLQNGQTT